MDLQEIERLRTAPEGDFRVNMATSLQQILDNQADDLVWRKEVRDELKEHADQIGALRRWRTGLASLHTAMWGAILWLAGMGK